VHPAGVFDAVYARIAAAREFVACAVEQREVHIPPTANYGLELVSSAAPQGCAVDCVAPVDERATLRGLQ